MGSARLQILKSFYGVGILSVAVVVFNLNVLHFRGVLHAGEIFYEDYHFLCYLWIDMMTALFLFGMAFLLFNLLYLLGLVRLTLCLMAIVISVSFYIMVAC